MGRLYITDCRPGERMNSGNDAMKALQRGLRRRQDTEAREADRVICGNSCGILRRAGTRSRPAPSAPR